MTNTTTTDKIRALLAKADSSPYPDEADAFRTKAMSIMMREGLTEDDVADSKSEQFEVVKKYVHVASTIWREAIQLAVVVGEANGAVVRMQAYAPKRPAAAVFCGTAAQVELCEVMFTSLILQLAHASRRRTKREDARQFAMGFALGVMANLREAKRTVENDAPGTGLVLVSMKQRIEEAMDPGRASKVRTARASQAGYRAGLAANTSTRIAIGR